MDKEIKLREVHNGYEVAVKNEASTTIWVFKHNEELEMLEKIGKWLTTRRVVVKER